MLYPYKGKMPTVDETVFIAPGAHIIGDVTIGKESTIWFNAVLRGTKRRLSLARAAAFRTTRPAIYTKGRRLLSKMK